MKYDFTTIMDRRGKDALAVDMIPYPNVTVKEGFSTIPMWVADMNFATAPSIQEQVGERLAHPAYGYFMPTDEYFDSIIRWQKEQNGVEGLKKEHIGYENGVLGCVVSAMNALACPGDPVLVHAPTYIGFTHCLEDNGYKIVHSQLVRDERGTWRMDYADMDAKLKEHKIHVAVFCTPHNPTGRVWERWEIEKAMEVYAANDCYVISDEIWSDITLNGHRHIPTQSISEDAKKRTVAIYAPSKTFNLAGFIGSYHIIYDAWLRDRVVAASSKSNYNHMNVLSMHALIGGYTPAGQEWVRQLREVLSENVNYGYDYIKTHFEGVELAKPQGTYMLYLDCEKWCKSHNKTLDDLLKAGMEVGVIWQDGRPFHRPWAIRMNLAVPHSLVVEAFRRLDAYVFKT